MSDTSGDPPIASGIAADRVERLTKTIRDQSFPNLKPRDFATLILIDRTESVPKVLLGRRHERHRFMPGKFVFPGGRIEPSDRQMATLSALHDRHVARLMTKVRHASAEKAAGFALAAIRETYEETGLMLGAPSMSRSPRRRGLGRRSPKPASFPTSAQSTLLRARSRRRSGRGVSTAGSLPPISPRSRSAPTVLSAPTRSWSSWSGCRSPRRGGSICRELQRSRWKSCRTAWRRA